jgi:hypothetical protein
MMRSLLLALGFVLAFSGSAAAQSTGGGGSTTLTGPLPAGTNAIGTVGTTGSTGTDYSANAATIPISGFVLLATIPVNATRAFAEVQNQSAGTLQVVRDDGSGNNQTTILLASGGTAGSQGGGWSSTTFKGRIRVYGATGAQCAADQD